MATAREAAHAMRERLAGRPHSDSGVVRRGTCSVSDPAVSSSMLLLYLVLAEMVGGGAPPIDGCIAEYTADRWTASCFG